MDKELAQKFWEISQEAYVYDSPWTAEQFASAQRLYRRLGFSSRNIRKNYYTENSEDALDMIKHLDVELGGQ